MTSSSEIFIQATATDPAVGAQDAIRQWDYLENGPDQWQVRIGRVDAGA